MKQLTLDLLMNLDQPLTGLVEFYESSPAVQAALTCRDLQNLIKANWEFFDDSVVITGGETFLRESFRERLNEWLDLKNPNNLPKAA